MLFPLCSLIYCCEVSVLHVFPVLSVFFLVLIFLLCLLFSFHFVSFSHLVSAVSSSQEVSTCLPIFSVYKCLFTPVLCVSSCVLMCFWFVFKPALWVLHLHPILFPASNPNTGNHFGGFLKVFPTLPTVILTQSSLNSSHTVDFTFLRAGKNKMKDKDNE